MKMSRNGVFFIFIWQIDVFLPTFADKMITKVNA